MILMALISIALREIQLQYISLIMQGAVLEQMANALTLAQTNFISHALVSKNVMLRHVYAMINQTHIHIKLGALIQQRKMELAVFMTGLKIAPLCLQNALQDGCAKMIQQEIIKMSNANIAMKNSALQGA
jgi:hypothetical protein